MESFDDDAVQRILARARRDDPALDAGLDAEALVAAAEEIGLDADAVRESVAIERLGEVPASAGVLDRLAGSTAIVRQQRLACSADAATDRVEVLLARTHRMAVRRSNTGTLIARPRTDVGASVARSVASLRGHGRLGRSRSIEVTVVPVDPEAVSPSCVMRVVAVRANDRRRRLTIGGAAGGTGVAVVAVGIAESLFAWPLVGGVLVGAGAIGTLSGRRHADRIGVEVEELLDAVRLERLPASQLQRVAELARRRLAR